MILSRNIFSLQFSFFFSSLLIFHVSCVYTSLWFFAFRCATKNVIVGMTIKKHTKRHRRHVGNSKRRKFVRLYVLIKFWCCFNALSKELCKTLWLNNRFSYGFFFNTLSIMFLYGDTNDKLQVKAAERQTNKSIIIKEDLLCGEHTLNSFIGFKKYSTLKLFLEH